MRTEPRSSYYVWLNFGQGYLKSSRLCCQELLEPKHNSIKLDPFAPKNWETSYYARHLFQTIIFNAKQGAECFLKSLILNLGLEVPIMHNLEQLFEKVKTEVLVKEWVVIPNKISAADIRHAKSTYLNHLSQQINWLHNNLILQEKLGMPLIPDLMNELFRYPVMKNGASYDFDLLLSKLNRTDIKRIRKRIDIMLRRFNDLGYIIAVELRHSPQITLKPFRPG